MILIAFKDKSVISQQEMKSTFDSAQVALGYKIIRRAAPLR